MKTFVTFFPYLKNIHLVKDVGIIPWMFHRLFGFRSEITCFELDDYSYLQQETSGLHLTFLPQNINLVTDTTFSIYKLFLINNAHRIDILNLYDISSSIVKLSRLYKKINPSGKLYIKLDRGLNYTVSRNPIKRLRECYLELCLMKFADLVSAESTQSCEFFTRNTFLRPEYIPNGYTRKIQFTPSQKSKTILFVGDVSLEPKRLDLILDAFLRFSVYNHEWKLKFIGPVKEDFSMYWEKYKQNNAEIISKIEIAGPQYDRNLLDEEYRRASVFVLASDHESFGIVLPEAIRAACIPVVSSGVASANDITDFGRLGFVFERGSAQSLSSALSKAIERAGDTSFLQKIVKHSEAFYWPTICSRIKDLLGEP